MTTIIMAEQYGFCRGVSRAVNLLHEVAQKNPNRKIVTIGALIHNSDFLKEMKKLGIEVVDEKAQLMPKTIALIRTHGLPPDRVAFFQKQGVELIDCQIETPHLISLGAQIMMQDDFLEFLKIGLKKSGKKGDFIEPSVWKRDIMSAKEFLQ